MKSLVILAAALAAVAMPAQAADYAWPVLRVIDGGTIVVDASADLPAELADLRVRLRGVDAPEKGHRAACDAEREKAAEATLFVAELLDAAETIVVRKPDWGKWGGRVVAEIVLDDRYSLAELVVDFGHGREYDGAEARLGWCGGEAPPETAGPAHIHAEIELYLVDPCIEFALDAGMASPTERAALGDDGLARAVKARAAPMLANLAAILRPYVPHREREFRMKVYDVFREFCKMELRRKHLTAGAG